MRLRFGMYFMPKCNRVPRSSDTAEPPSVLSFRRWARARRSGA
jgi:hypothetical protein